MDILISIAGSVFALSLIIIVHEFGHYWVARRCRVHVECFSIGFGPSLYSHTTKNNMLFKIGCLPFGGYVKLQGDEFSGPTSKKAHPNNYLNKPLWQRMLIVLAGPFINFILTIIIFTFIYAIGFSSIAPIIKSVIKPSIAHRAGLKPQDRFISVDNVNSVEWPDVILPLIIHYQDPAPVKVVVRNNGQLRTLYLPLEKWVLSPDSSNVLFTLGLVPLTPTPLPIIRDTLANSPAAALLKKNDKILSINNTRIVNMYQLQRILQLNGDKTVQLKVKRQHKTLTMVIKPQATNVNGSTRFLLGFTPLLRWPKDLKNHVKFPFFSAIEQACNKLFLILTLNVVSLYKLLAGILSLQYVGGPVAIFIMGGKSLKLGIVTYCSFIATISAAIGFLNCLPIPGLDGGHFLFQLIELIRKKPLALKTQIQAIKAGIIMLILFILIITYHDIVRALST